MSKNVIGTTKSQRKFEIANSTVILVLIIWDARGAFRKERKRRFHLIEITGFILFGPIFNTHQPMLESL